MDHQGGGGYRGRGGGGGRGYGGGGGGGYHKRPREARFLSAFRHALLCALISPLHRAQEAPERSPLLRVREFVMRNEGTEDHLRQCTALLTAEIDAGRAGMVRSLPSPRRPSTASGRSGNALSLRARAERGRIGVRYSGRAAVAGGSA
jgi:hypothetical protein